MIDPGNPRRTPAGSRRWLRRSLVLGGTAAAIAILASVPTTSAGRGGRQIQIPTTPADFFQPGTQPNPDPFSFDPIQTSLNCTFCHSDYDVDTAPFDTWTVSLMGQSARDPVWHAALTIANQDVHGAGEFCIRCHAPGAWLGGRSTTGTIEEFHPEDFDGINCNFCHRVVNPELGPDSAVGYPGDPPEPDVPILAALAKEGLIPQGSGNARFVVDPADNRRGPLDDIAVNLHGLTPSGDLSKLIYSPFHTKGQMCGTCHDVSNPVFVKTKSGSYAPGKLGEPHPTQNPHDMFPEQRTYSEWLNSTFATEGVFFEDRRFGGPDHPTGIMSSCQDCHMPLNFGGACAFAGEKGEFPFRNVPQHSFAGANTWVIAAIRTVLADEADFIGLTEERVDAARMRNIQMLRDASDMQITQEKGDVVVRVVNQTGHKLPTGYPEGRRMWLNVKFLDAKGGLVQEIGGYDFKTATADLTGAKVYEAKHGIDKSVASLTGLPVGPNFHLALANTKYFDNRIPPRGFTNAAYAEIGALPVGVTYADGQYWDDTTYPIPAGAARVVATLYYQTT